MTAEQQYFLLFRNGYTWTTKDKKILKIKDMERSHVYNSLKMLLRDPRKRDTFLLDIMMLKNELAYRANPFYMNPNTKYEDIDILDLHNFELGVQITSYYHYKYKQSFEEVIKSHELLEIMSDEIGYGDDSIIFAGND